MFAAIATGQACCTSQLIDLPMLQLLENPQTHIFSNEITPSQQLCSGSEHFIAMEPMLAIATDN